MFVQQRSILFKEHTVQIEHRVLLFYQLCMPDDIIQRAEAHLRQIFTHLFGQERKVVDQMVCLAQEMLTQSRILCGHAHRTGVHVALTHHHTTQYNQGGGTETELISPQ